VVTATNLGLRRSDPEPTQRRRIACGQDLVVVVGVKGGGENFSDGEILKTTTVGPLQYDDYYTVLLSRAPVQSNMDGQYSITSPDPQLKALTTSHRRTSERANERTNEQIYGLLNPRAIARGACGHLPFYCRNTASSLDYDPRFSLSSFNGVVTL
jgi:hypothetical protein